MSAVRVPDGYEEVDSSEATHGMMCWYYAGYREGHRNGHGGVLPIDRVRYWNGYLSESGVVHRVMFLRKIVDEEADPAPAGAAGAAPCSDELVSDDEEDEADPAPAGAAVSRVRWVSQGDAPDALEHYAEKAARFFTALGQVVPDTISQLFQEFETQYFGDFGPRAPMVRAVTDRSLSPPDRLEWVRTHFV